MNEGDPSDVECASVQIAVFALKQGRSEFQPCAKTLALFLKVSIKHK